MFTLIYLPFLGSFVALMLAEGGDTWTGGGLDDDGVAGIITFILVTIASDIGGYVAGVLFGKHPMAPVISPKKSWEGFAGSLLACLGAGWALVVYLLDGDWWVGLCLGVIAVVMATLGDLCESVIKRDLGIKDMSQVIPGHGGLMDRLDSLLATIAPIWLLLHYAVYLTRCPRRDQRSSPARPVRSVAMDQAVETPGTTATDPTRVAAELEDASAPVEASVPADEEHDSSRRRLPEWWHRDHPVFVPLAGFFTGMLFIILVPGTYAAVLKAMVGYQRAEDLFPFVLLTLVVPIGLLAPHHTRRFGRYMLFGVVATAVVVVGVALGVLWFLLHRDR